MFFSKQIMVPIALVLIFSSSAFADIFTDYQLLKISAPDQRAVVKNPEGLLQVIGVGDEVDNLQVTEIAEGRVVLTGKDLETVIIRLENGRQRIETYQRLADQAPVLTAPEMSADESAPSAGSKLNSGYQ